VQQVNKPNDAGREQAREQRQGASGKCPEMWAFPRDAQRDAQLAEVAYEATLTFSPFSSKSSVISLPYENRRAMKDDLKPT
jgi:hypothetical protein